jgi:4-amino-4-deoxy-L-arabinose transferase-like glycosyltransferase
MLAIPPSYSFPMLVVFFIVLSLFIYEPLRRKLRPKHIAILAIVPLLVCVPIYVINSQEVSAYYVGDVVFRWGTWNFTIGPSDVERIDDVSNIHTKAYANIVFSCESNVTFYLIDQNTPEIHHREANYSEESIGFRLPYLFTEAGVPARWSVCLMNPNLDFVNVSIQSIWLEDSIEIAWWSIDYNLYLPLVLLFGVWIALGTPLLVIHRKRMSSQEFQIGIALTLLGTSLGIVLSILVPFFPSVILPIAVYLIILQVFFFKGEKKTIPQGPTVDII